MRLCNGTLDDRAAVSGPGRARGSHRVRGRISCRPRSGCGLGIARSRPAYRDLNVPPTNAQLPHDFDPLAPDHDDSAFGDGFHGPVQSDHSSSMDDAMIPPPITGYASPGAGGIIPGDDLLPDDWDKDLL